MDSRDTRQEPHRHHRRSHEAELVESGPYAWVRHPYYLAAGILMFGVVLLTANLLIGLACLLLLGLLIARTGREEKLLFERFGDRYRNYAKRTGRFSRDCGGRGYNVGHGLPSRPLLERPLHVVGYLSAEEHRSDSL